MTNELEQKLVRSKILFGHLEESIKIMMDKRGFFKNTEHLEIGIGIKALYLQNEVILGYLQEIYKERKK